MLHAKVLQCQSCSKHLRMHHTCPALAGERGFRAQVTQHLLHTYWGSWCADTQTLLAQLPAALRQPDSSVAVTFERWLLELKVAPRHLVAVTVQ